MTEIPSPHPRPTDTITQMTTVPIRCNPSDTMDTRKADNGFSNFRSPLNRFSKPNRSLDTVLKEKRETFERRDTRKAVGVHHGQRDR